MEAKLGYAAALSAGSFMPTLFLGLIRRFRDAGGDSMEYRRPFKDLGKEFPTLGLS
jgi:hypothetical protein